MERLQYSEVLHHLVGLFFAHTLGIWAVMQCQHKRKERDLKFNMVACKDLNNGQPTQQNKLPPRVEQSQRLSIHGSNEDEDVLIPATVHMGSQETVQQQTELTQQTDSVKQTQESQAPTSHAKEDGTQMTRRSEVSSRKNFSRRKSQMKKTKATRLLKAPEKESKANRKKDSSRRIGSNETDEEKMVANTAIEDSTKAPLKADEEHSTQS